MVANAPDFLSVDLWRDGTISANADYATHSLLGSPSDFKAAIP
jgi:hypothetical protein